MSRKFDFIPQIPNYEWIRQQMSADLAYRLQDRQVRTSLGRPLYYRINVQIIMTQECPFHCPFCLERQHPMKGAFHADAQKDALKYILAEHPNARLTITGGEPGLYPDHVDELLSIYSHDSGGVFCSINTSGYDTRINDVAVKYGAKVNLSINDYVKPNPADFPNCTVQTVLSDDQMNLENLKKFMNESSASNFSFRFLSGLEAHDYNVQIFNQLQDDPEIEVSTFRVGDFFVYATFNYKGRHARVTLGDMYQQTHNDYQDGYSNIIIHPDGHIGINWN